MKDEKSWQASLRINFLYIAGVITCLSLLDVTVFSSMKWYILHAHAFHGKVDKHLKIFRKKNTSLPFSIVRYKV